MSRNIKDALRWLWAQLPIFCAVAFLAILTGRQPELGIQTSLVVWTVYVMGRRHADIAWRQRRIEAEANLVRHVLMQDVEKEMDRLQVPDADRERLRDVWLKHNGPMRVFPDCKTCGAAFDPSFHVKKLPRQATMHECAVCRSKGSLP